MRREGFELAVSRPRVVMREIDGVICEPYESLSVDVEETHQGAVMEALGVRRGDLTNMESDSQGRTRLEYRIPARGLIGFQGEFMNLTRGTGLMSHVFDGYAPVKGDIPERRNGVLISAEDGPAVAYALWKLQDRGRMFVSPGEMLYEGMVIGIHSRDNDLVVNPIKGKQLTNVRASGTDEAVRLVPPIQLNLEYAVEFIADDELVEVTPQVDPHPQAPPEGTRAQEGEPRSGVARECGGDLPAAPRPLADTNTDLRAAKRRSAGVWGRAYPPRTRPLADTNTDLRAATRPSARRLPQGSGRSSRPFSLMTAGPRVTTIANAAVRCSDVQQPILCACGHGGCPTGKSSRQMRTAANAMTDWVRICHPAEVQASGTAAALLRPCVRAAWHGVETARVPVSRPELRERIDAPSSPWRRARQWPTLICGNARLQRLGHTENRGET